MNAAMNGTGSGRFVICRAVDGMRLVVSVGFYGEDVRIIVRRYSMVDGFQRLSAALDSVHAWAVC
jgi:hypothetical protein